MMNADNPINSYTITLDDVKIESINTACKDNTVLYMDGQFSIRDLKELIRLFEGVFPLVGG